MKAQLKQKMIYRPTGSAGISDGITARIWLMDFLQALAVAIPPQDEGWRHKLILKDYGSDKDGWRKELTVEVQRLDGVVVDLFLERRDLEDSTPVELALECRKAAEEVKYPGNMAGRRVVVDEEDDLTQEAFPD